MIVESIGMLLFFQYSGFYNPRLETYESWEHTFWNYCKFKKYFTVDCFLQLEDINRRKIVQCMKVTWRCIDMSMELHTKQLMGGFQNSEIQNVMKIVRHQVHSRCMTICHVVNRSGTPSWKFFTRCIIPLDHYLHFLEQQKITRGCLHSADTTEMQSTCWWCSISECPKMDLMVLGMMYQMRCHI